jgi:diguanylate cyclase (GGDEF)-like protein
MKRQYLHLKIGTGMVYRQLLLRLIFVAMAALWAGQARAVPLAVDYRCDGAVLFDVPAPTADGWVSAKDGKVPLDPQDHACWIRVSSLPQGGIASGLTWLSFADLNVQRVDIALFDTTGRKLGQATRLGQSEGALVTGMRAIFTSDPTAIFPLYARFEPVQGTQMFPGFARTLLVEAVNPAESLREEQSADLLNQSGAIFLLTTALVALFFAFALRDANYGIYATYAGLQSLTIFSKSGLPFVLDTSSPIWLNAWVFNYLVAVLSVLLSVRFGRFAVHSPRTAHVAYGVAIAFLLIIPLHYYVPALGALIIYLLVPLHFLVLLTGNWRGWRLGERGCGILLLGLTPIALYWFMFVFYKLLLHEAIPSELALGSGFDFVRTLLLPVAFCYGIADRTLRLQRETARMARFDTLTDLHNREGLRQYGQGMIDRGVTPSTLMLNIERFRIINETLGPALGDQILKLAGQRLLRVCKAHSKCRVGRMHADEFCILFPRADMLGAIRATIEKEFTVPAEVEGQAVDIALMAGVARAGKDGHSMSQLLRNAEIALDAGRAQKKNWMEYSADLETSHRADLDLLSELKRAVEQNELRIYLQPKVRMKDGAVTSAEALVRWMHPKRGLIPPNDFVPFAEKTGRITLLTNWVLEQAMRLVAARRAQGQPLQISVNLSTFDLGEQGFAARLAAMALRMDANPDDIRLEITESSAMQDPIGALEVMKALRSAGFTLSIDDFGTGYSSLAYLQKMPVAELKIDRAFVRDAQPGSDGASLLDSTIALGHRLGLIVVAEGAENQQEWDLLRSLGCDYAQGWFAAKPMPVEDFDHWCGANLPFLPGTGVAPPRVDDAMQ